MSKKHSDPNKILGQIERHFRVCGSVNRPLVEELITLCDQGNLPARWDYLTEQSSKRIAELESQNEAMKLELAGPPRARLKHAMDLKAQVERLQRLLAEVTAGAVVAWSRDLSAEEMRIMLTLPAIDEPAKVTRDILVNTEQPQPPKEGKTE